MIHVIATIQLNEGCRDEFLDHFRALLPSVLEEAGCVDYGPTIDVPTTIPAQGPPRDDVVTVVERWESTDALADHLIAPHMNEYRTKVKDLVAGMTLQVLEPA
jgi:quinol monooxygenase YgiN